MKAANRHRNKQIKIIKTFWNDTLTSLYIDKVGRLDSFESGFIDIYFPFNGTIITFHHSECSLYEESK
jgi:hypothetical protein